MVFCVTETTLKKLNEEKVRHTELIKSDNYIPYCIGRYLYNKFGITAFRDMLLESQSETALIYKVSSFETGLIYHILISPKGTWCSGHREYSIDGCW